MVAGIEGWPANCQPIYRSFSASLSLNQSLKQVLHIAGKLTMVRHEKNLAIYDPTAKYAIIRIDTRRAIHLVPLLRSTSEDETGEMACSKQGDFKVSRDAE